MIYVTQGHELGIGLEVFFKSLLTLPVKDSLKFTLIVNIKTLEKNLSILKIRYILKNDLLIIQKHILKLIIISDSNVPQSTASLEIGLIELKTKNGILLTLPTSKDQLIYGQEVCLGYTEYLRSAFKNSHLAMFFYSEKLKVLLLTDHLPLVNVSEMISEDLVIKKINYAIEFFKFDHIYVSGINPHAGENGLLGKDEFVLNKSLDKLKRLHPKIIFSEPIPGDILHYKINYSEKQLLVYCFHDQGLVLFKSRQGLVGINITLGLPFLRMSVDHGTGFDLYGKNRANYLGCFYTLKKALEFYE